MLCRNHRPFQVRSTGLLNLNLFNTVNTNSACCLPIHSLPYAGRPGPYASCVQGEENLCAWSCCKRVVENVGALENRWCVRADRKPTKSVQAPTKTGMALNRKSVFEVGSRIQNLENDTVSLPPSG